ncbi:NADP-dependent oxidoreductase [Compostimonas suwonensis]|uniref:NADPH:quinone reductase-like Zn-dependent oxidoreductase n=1 Tax=Compostimonas suwonensis TaxID=1048394 RepID=A0A2M9BYY2_9MICO|nr:NADP-dependent oxidoreductase [Compostimonas suwonensis]PJJ63289.1 NADPH:quinone reductase-like Zn-dependent oxidoreductase [Compostimonas suwonensis]
MDAEPTTTNTPPLMRALRAHEKGGPERLVYEEAPRPVPGPDEIRVAVRAAAITFAELSWPETWEAGGRDRTPIIPSHEFAGVVDELGPGASGVSVGDSVFGLVPFDRDGAAAEFVVVPAACVARKETTVSDVDAAAAVLPALTAWEALRDQTHLAAGQRLLIRGGTGGVGAFLTQFAHGMGAEVTVTVTSSASAARARSLGADHVVVAASPVEAGDPLGFDVAIDAVGDDVPEWMYASVRPGGQLVFLHQPPSQELAGKYGVNADFFVVSTEHDRLEELAAVLAAGGVDVAIAQTFPLAEGRAAYESGSLPKPGPGKTVIVVS